MEGAGRPHLASEHGHRNARGKQARVQDSGSVPLRPFSPEGALGWNKSPGRADQGHQFQFIVTLSELFLPVSLGFLTN